MNYKFLPFAIGMALASTAANAETFEELNVEGATNLKGGVAIGGRKASDRTLLDISIPKGAETSSLIYSCDLNQPSNNTIFEVSNKGELKCQDWTVTEKNVGGQYTGRLHCAYDKDEDGFKFSTHGYNRNYPISFDATKFTFNGGGLEVKKETVLDSTLLVKGKSSFDDVATFNNSIGVWGVASLESASITIPWIQVDKSGKKERTQNCFINCYDALTNAYNNMFKVSYDGYVGAVSLGLSASPLDNSYCAKLHCKYNNDEEGWQFDTESYGGGPQNRFYPILFKAKGYTFDGGDMVVNGKITCKDELNVTAINTSSIKTDDINVNMSNVADYVFDENYNLKSLSEVESYVNEHKHLPGIPSAAEIEQNGVSLSKMSNMLLEKVEELTLHLIRLEKENAELKAKFESLEK